MKKLKLQIQTSVDGFMAGPNGEMDWMEWNWDESLKQYVTDLTNSVDTILLGRKLAEGFIPYWENVAKDPNNPQAEAGVQFTNLRKIVFSKTVQSMKGVNTIMHTGDLAIEVKRLKKETGKDLIAYGGSSFVTSLIAEKLVDEFHLFVNPTAIGKGLTIFKHGELQSKLQLIKATPFECGIVLLQYVPR